MLLMLAGEDSCAFSFMQAIFQSSAPKPWSAVIGQPRCLFQLRSPPKKAINVGGDDECT
jgi:hypothetical protein